MLGPRRESWMLAAILTGCASPAATDAGRDAWSYDASWDVMRRDGASNDAPDVAPTVDVVVFDATAQDASTEVTGVADGGAAGPCNAIAEQYARTVREAQSCREMADCATVVCETICCSCQVYVSGPREYLDLLAMLQREWESMRCEEAAPCMRYMCGAPLATECTTAGRCATVRRGD